MVVALIIMIPVVAILTGLFTAWGLYTGLKWQIQTQRGQEPEKPVSNPVKEIFEIKTQKEQAKAQETILDEWLNGPKEERE